MWLAPCGPELQRKPGENQQQPDLRYARVTCSEPQPVHVVFRNRTPISKTSSVLKTQAHSCFQIRHWRPETENDQNTDHAQHKTNGIEYLRMCHIIFAIA